MTKKGVTLKQLSERIQELEYDDFINDITDKEAEGIALRFLQWSIINHLDSDLLDYFLSDVREEKD